MTGVQTCALPICIDVTARYFAEFTTIDELSELLEFNKQQIEQSEIPKHFGTPDNKFPVLILGGGSNILFTKDFNGLVLKNNIAGIKIIKEDEHHVYVKVGAGENWHQFVLHCIKNNWAGVENLSLIPGNTGASPMQNIGAYGVELKEVCYCLDAFHIKEKKIVEFSVNDCAFGYRDSVFKKKIQRPIYHYQCCLPAK